MNSQPPRPDLIDRDGIELLVNSFYDTVREDDQLGFIFDQLAKVNWDAHLPKMYSFWETVLFRSGGYKGNPIASHAKLLPLTDLGKDKFDHWLALFEATVDQHFAGENADHIKRCAADMANVIFSKINNVPDPRFDPANLTPEQKARYAAYRKNPESEQ
ncbi:MAG: group III truncated hemoglobin [Verrucomicrobiaceae bacterium]